MVKETETTIKSVKIKFIGAIETTLIGVGTVAPGETLEVTKEEYEQTYKNTGLFKIIK